MSNATSKRVDYLIRDVLTSPEGKMFFDGSDESWCLERDQSGDGGGLWLYIWKPQYMLKWRPIKCEDWKIEDLRPVLQQILSHEWRGKHF